MRRRDRWGFGWGRDVVVGLERCILALGGGLGDGQSGLAGDTREELAGHGRSRQAGN